MVDREAIGPKGTGERNAMLQIVINGKCQSLPTGTTVSGLLETLGIAGPKVAVERNLAIVPKSTFETLRLEDGDRIEIVQFVGGG